MFRRIRILKRKLPCYEPANRQDLSTSTQKWKPVNDDSLRLMFFGTDNFSLPSLDALRKSYVKENSLGVVTSFKSPANCVRLHAEEHRLPLFRWPVNDEVCRQYDLGVVVSFGHLIPEKIINAFPQGMINVHASLLPRWRGAAPIIHAIMHNDKTTGVSIMRVAPHRFDVGDVLDQREIPIEPDILMPQLHAQLAAEGANLLLKVLREFPHSFRKANPQRKEDVTFAPKITPAMTEVDWTQTDAAQLYRLFRALYGYKPLITQFQDKQVQLLELRPLNEGHEMEKIGYNQLNGSFAYQRERKCILVCCAGGTQIEVHKLRLEGKKPMSAMEFNNGFIRKGIDPKHLIFEKATNNSETR